MKIALVNTGGTIDSIGSPLAPMSSEQFRLAFTKILSPIIESKYPDLEICYPADITFPATGLHTLDSTNLQPQDWCVIAEKILETYDQYDGWLILHGTDSMAYTASALSFLLSSVNRLGAPTSALTKPVILTGSQVPLFSQDSPEDPLTLRYSTDGYKNICSAIDFLHTRIPEVTLAFNGSLFRGNRTAKINANMDAAFGSPNFAPLAEVGTNLFVNRALISSEPPKLEISLDNPAVLKRAQERLSYISEQISSVKVMPLASFPATFGKSGPSFLSRIIDAVVSVGLNGLVLESYGEGNFPSGALPTDSIGDIHRALEGASKSGVHIVDCTQVLTGHIDFNAYAAGAWLATIGAVPGQDMTPIAAFAKMTILLAEQNYSKKDWGPEDIPYLLGTNLAGEMTSAK